MSVEIHRKITLKQKQQTPSTKFPQVFFFSVREVVNYRLYLLIKLETNQDKLSFYDLSTSCQPTRSNYSSTYNKKRL